MGARRSLTPAQHAAQTLLRFQAEHCGAAQLRPEPGLAPGVPQRPDDPSSQREVELSSPSQRAASEPLAAGPRSHAGAEANGSGWAKGAGEEHENTALEEEQAGQRRIRSHPVLLGMEGASRSPARGGAQPPAGDSDLSGGMSGEGAQPAIDGAGQGRGALGYDRGLEHRNGGAETGAGSGRPGAANPTLGSPVPWRTGLARGANPLLGSPAPGPFSELQRAAALGDAPERSVELCPAGPHTGPTHAQTLASPAQRQLI